MVTFLRKVDGDQPIAGKVYHRFFNLVEHIKEMQNLDEDRKEELLLIIERRWEDAHSDMHSAGYALDPEYAGHDYFSNEEVAIHLNWSHSMSHS